MSTASIQLYTRPGEVQLGIVRADAGICRSCDKPLSEGRFAWDHRISIGPGYDGIEWTLGEDSFTLLRHSDGTKPCWTGSADLAKPQCGSCKAYDCFDVAQEPYGDRVTCRSCGACHWYPIGD